MRLNILVNIFSVMLGLSHHLQGINQKGILDCQKAPVASLESSIYVIHSHFGNPKHLLMAI